MSISSFALIIALAALPMGQDAEPRVETRSEVRIVTLGGEGPGRLDADEDGFVTREEFTAPMGSAFDRLDADQDGRLSTEELRSRHGEGDDHDGPLILNLRGPGPEVRLFGGHGPGDIMMFRGGSGGGRDRDIVALLRRGGPDGDMEWRGPGAGRVEIRRFGGPDGPGDMDADGDGRITEDEFLAPLREAFQRLDADRDGVLDDREGPAAHHDD